MLKKLFGKAVGGLMVKEVRERIKGSGGHYSLSFEDTKLPWKELNKFGDRAIFGQPDKGVDFSWDKKFVSTELDGKSSILLFVGVLNLNNSTIKTLLSQFKGERADKKELEEVEALLKMLRVGKTFQEAVRDGKKSNAVFKGLEESMDALFKMFFSENDDTKRISRESYSENFYGLESWSKIEQGVEGDEWLYVIYIPVGGVIYSIKALVPFEKLKDEVRSEIEQIARSFRFDIAPIAMDELDKILDELEKKKGK